jgi:hypothetical protein
MSLIRNAIDSIEMGVEDYEHTDPRRAASAVRNFFAGVLLLLKEKLRQESPMGSNEALLYEKIVYQRAPDGRVVFIGTGKKTVDVAQIQERFKNLGLALDTAPLNQLQKIRNDIEHHDASKHPHAKVQAAIAATFVLVARVLEDHLGQKSNSVLSDKVWQTMLKEAGTYKEIEERCRRSKAGMVGVPDAAAKLLECLECPECGSSLLEAMTGDYIESEYECRVCGEKTTLAAVMPPALAAAYSGAKYEAHKNGGVDPIGTCPTCGEDAFHVEDDICLVCCERRPYEHCERCSAELSLDEQETGYCSWCQHMYDKLMDD